MASQKQIDANRENSRHSTGPKTPAGKTASSMNALRDGLRARTIILPGEQKADFDLMHDEIRDSYPPETPNERYLIEHAVIAQWKLIRLEKQEAFAYESEHDPALHFKIFDRSTQIQIRLQRAYTHAIAQLEEIKFQREARETTEAEPPKEVEPHSDQQKEPPASNENPQDFNEETRHLPRYEYTFEDERGYFKQVLFRTEYGKYVDEWTTPCPEWEAEEAEREEHRRQLREANPDYYQSNPNRP